MILAVVSYHQRYSGTDARSRWCQQSIPGRRRCRSLVQAGSAGRQRLERRSRSRALADKNKSASNSAAASPVTSTAHILRQTSRQERPPFGVRSISVWQRMKEWDRGFMPDGMSMSDLRRGASTPYSMVARRLFDLTLSPFSTDTFDTMLQNDFTVFLKASLAGVVNLLAFLMLRSRDKRYSTGVAEALNVMPAVKVFQLQHSCGEKPGRSR